MLSTNLSSLISAYSRDIFTLLSFCLSFAIQVGKEISITFVNKGAIAGVGCQPMGCLTNSSAIPLSSIVC